MFEIELFIFMKMDLALNNLQRLICHKPKETNIKFTTPSSKYLPSSTHTQHATSIFSSLRFGQNATQDQYFSGVQLVWIQSFPSPKPVDIPRLKSQYALHSWRQKRWFHAFRLAKWNTNSFLLNSNSSCWVYFLRRKPLR